MPSLPRMRVSVRLLTTIRPWSTSSGVYGPGLVEIAVQGQPAGPTRSIACRSTSRAPLPGRSVHAQGQVEVFDEVLNAGTDVLIEALETVSRENMEADIRRFVEALDKGLIEPFDF